MSAGYGIVRMISYALSRFRTVAKRWCLLVINWAMISLAHKIRRVSKEQNVLFPALLYRVTGSPAVYGGGAGDYDPRMAFGIPDPGMADRVIGYLFRKPPKP